MLTKYIETAIDHATFEILDDGTVYGEIPGLDGVWSDAVSEGAARSELREVLDGWIIVRLSRNLNIPEIDGVGLRARWSDSVSGVYCHWHRGELGCSGYMRGNQVYPAERQ